MKVQKTVVLVERDLIALDVIRQVLEQYGGYHVRVAHNLAGAKAALNLAGDVDVLVVDACIARCGASSDLCRHAIDRHSSIAIILTSDVEGRLPEAPARSQFLTKPFGIDALLGAMSGPSVHGKLRKAHHRPPSIRSEQTRSRVPPTFAPRAC